MTDLLPFAEPIVRIWRGGYMRPCVARECRYCARTFFAPTDDVKRGYGLYCSHHCRSKVNAPATSAIRTRKAQAAAAGRVSAPFHFEGELCCHLTLACGRKALISADDAAQVGRWMWSCARNGYVFAGKRGRLQRLVTNAPPGLVVDHINGDPLDNRRSNLQVVTHALNMQNLRGARANSRSGHLGVTRRNNGRYSVAMRVNGKRIWLGTFDTAEEAAAVAAAARAKMLPNSREARAAR